jgi:hypothetical protein
VGKHLGVTGGAQSVETQNGQELDQTFEAILRSVTQKVHDRQREDDVSRALFWLLMRESNTWRSISLLRRYTPPEFGGAEVVDVGTLLRAMFDAYLQADFIYRNPSRRAERASQYLEFQHVERFTFSQKVLSHNNSLTMLLNLSPKKAEGEKRVQQEYDRVKDTFKGTKYKWYKGNLADLAAAAGQAAEYDTFAASFSGCVHSSALALTNGPLVPPDQVTFLATTFAARVAKINAEYNQINIGEDMEILNEMCKSWLDEVNPPSVDCSV